jgi:hypothetical protein
VISPTRRPTAAAGPIPAKSAPPRPPPEASTVRGNYLRMIRHAVPTRVLQSGGSPTHDGLTRREGHGGRSPPRRPACVAARATASTITARASQTPARPDPRNPWTLTSRSTTGLGIPLAAAVEADVAHIAAKFGVSTRAELAAEVTRRETFLAPSTERPAAGTASSDTAPSPVHEGTSGPGLIRRPCPHLQRVETSAGIALDLRRSNGHQGFGE